MIMHRVANCIQCNKLSELRLLQVAKAIQISFTKGQEPETPLIDLGNIFIRSRLIKRLCRLCFYLVPSYKKYWICSSLYPVLIIEQIIACSILRHCYRCFHILWMIIRLFNVKVYKNYKGTKLWTHLIRIHCAVIIIITIISLLPWNGRFHKTLYKPSGLAVVLFFFSPFSESINIYFCRIFSTFSL